MTWPPLDPFRHPEPIMHRVTQGALLLDALAGIPPRDGALSVMATLSHDDVVDIALAALLTRHAPTWPEYAARDMPSLATEGSA